MKPEIQPANTLPARIAAFLAALALAFFGLVACSGESAGGAATAAQLAGEGQAIFTQHCVKCHGADGQKVPGSALMGADSALSHYPNAQGLYDYVSQNMPDDQPGSLSQAQYLQVISFLMLQGQYVQPAAPVSPNRLEQISFDKK